MIYLSHVTTHTHTFEPSARTDVKNTSFISCLQNSRRRRLTFNAQALALIETKYFHRAVFMDGVSHIGI